jgi:hypothetical protein
MGAAIRRIVASLQTAVGFHAVKYSHQSHRFDIRKLCQLRLADSFVIDQIYNYSALRERQTECTCSFFEALHVSVTHVFE